jgi:hypothetical protein
VLRSVRAREPLWVRGLGKGALIGTGVGAAAGAVYEITKKR